MSLTRKTKRELTTEPPPRVIAVPIEPETIRLPKKGEADPYFNMRRSALNCLVLPCAENDFKPPVRSYVLRQKGSRTGIRLIDFQSLKQYVHASVERAA